ncbi:ATP-binding protein [Aquiflexum lacus]|uniref:ATP-binding protein n=1 Tax=Aquiflexum lacus TaxID=2483805 RepID=UPI0018951350|nr:ATP-binding protein [Aquiflexum lacus]
MDAKKKKNLEETYKRILNVGFCIVPYEDISDIIGPDPMVYGTAKDERILSFEGVEALFKSQYEQMGNMKPAYERKRIALRISNSGNNACIIEELTFTLSSDKEIHTIFMRATCVMEYLDNQWKLTHWHTSTPVDTENDPWHMEEWKREKEKLQQLVDEQTAALKQNNRELQIEAALEKIRSSSLAMQKPDDLREVVKVLFEQMQGLSVDMGFASVSIFIFEDGSRNIRQWLPLPDGVSSMSVPYFDHPISSDLFDAKENGEDFFTKVYTLEEKNTWLAHGFEHTDYKDLPVDFKSSLLQAPGYAIAITLAKNSGICIPSFEGKLPTPEDIQIMKRVGKVFEQAYIRFLDLQKAEAQAKEAQIEVSLERVRSASMAMHKTDELGKVVEMLFLQFSELDLDFYQVWINIFRLEEGVSDCWFSPVKGVINEAYTALVPLEPFENLSIKTWKAGEEFSYLSWNGLGEVDKVMKELSALTNHPSFHQIQKKKRMKRVEIVDCNHKYGVIAMAKNEDITDNDRSILKRFANVFEQSYTRFLDLQKAESQAREAKIESALERVRSRSLAMHHSSELSAVVDTLLKEFTNLEFTLTFCIINLIDEQDMSNTVWAANPEEGKDPESYYMKFEDYPFHHAMWDAWKAQKKRFVYTIEGEEKKIYDQYLYNDTEFRRFPKNVQEANKSLERYVAGFTFFKYSGLQTVSVNPISEDELEILERFGRVFEQAYTRFLDLQKAEAQAREAEIQLALERVRAKTMAMKTQSDLLGIIELFGEQLNAVGIRFDNVTFIEGPITKKRDWDLWSYAPEAENTTDKILIPYIETPYFTKTAKAVKEYQKTGQPIQVKTFTKKEKNEFLDHYWKHVPAVSDEFVNYVNATPGSIIVDAFLEEITVSMVKWNTEPYTYEELEIYERFAKEFRQTYIRFLDIKKAEAQAKEAKIEVALEKVRSRTMAMQKAEELGDVATVLFSELNTLVDNLWTCGFVLCEKNRQEDEWWLSLDNGLIQPFFLPNIGDYAHESLYEGWKKGESYRTVTLQDEVLQEHYDWLMNIPISRKIFEEMEGSGIPRPNWQRLHAAYFKTGYLVIITEVPCEAEEIFKRFAQVFDLTYTRFLDLQKAENQAKESQIEASLERVRAKALAMHNSEDLRQTITAIFEELKGLNIKTIRLGLGLVNPDSPEGEIVTSRIDEKDHILEVSGKFRLEGDPVLDSVYNHFKQQKDYFPILEGEEINSYYSALQGYVNVQGQGTDTKHFGCFLYFKEGCLYAWSAEPHSEGQIGILKKFSRVVEITYRRYKDLLESEYREKEAVKQASLDRVRAEIASMRNTNDLERITPLIWKELTTLGIPFLRCGVFIMDEQEELIHTFLSTPDGKAIAAFHLPYTSNPFFNAIEEWRAKKIHISHWDTEEFSALADSLVKEGQLTNREQYLNSVPKGGLYLHYVPFLQGIVYVGNTAELTNENLQLVQSVADAFSTAYARYEDFVKLEQAKAEVDSAMSELKATQSQLVQQEKLASLGQLTAGIAHEIKNPLNFVNNFSEVSIEMIEEIIDSRHKVLSRESGRQDTRLKTEADEIEDEILEDIKGNLKKIHEHGSRANGIVTSMLQHSRGGSGKMEPTELNALIKEYVNLSFHGMRAGKNPIDVDLVFDVDPELGEVSLIKEDFTRVVINLCNNAFDAMRSKKYQVKSTKNQDGAGKDENYAPKFRVTTRSENGQVRIAFEDNGPGIPEDIKDKILQPFFTTKKGTEGTGLGLSITQDIVKAHGGELEIETTISKGTNFIIKLNR